MEKYIKIENAAKAFSIYFPYCYGDCLNGLNKSILDGTIEQEDVSPVVHGKWEKGNMPTYGGYKCSVCGGHTIHYKANYCPVCGAKMDL